MSGHGSKIPSVLEAVFYCAGALILGITFWSGGSMNPMWSVIAFVLVFDPDSKQAWSVAGMRFAATVWGSFLALLMVWSFHIHRWTLPVGVGMGALVCGLMRMSRPFRRIVLVTIALIIGSSFLENVEAASLAVARSIEVCAGSALAAVFSWGFRFVGRRSLKEESERSAQAKHDL